MSIHSNSNNNIQLPLTDPTSSNTIVECAVSGCKCSIPTTSDEKHFVATCKCEKHSTRYNTIHVTDRVPPSNKKVIFSLPPPIFDVEEDTFHVMDCVYEQAKSVVEKDDKTRYRINHGSSVPIHDMGLVVLDDEMLSSKDFMRKYSLSFSRLYELKNILPAWVKLPDIVQSNSGVIIWLWSVVALLSEYAKNLAVCGSHSFKRETENFATIYFDPRALHEEGFPHALDFDFKQQIFFRDENRQVFQGQTPNCTTSIYCPRCESCSANFVEGGTESHRVLCSGDCGIVPISQYCNDVIHMVECSVLTRERISFIIPSTPDLTRSSAQIFVKFMENTPFPWNSNYKNTMDDYLFYYSEQCFVEQNKMFQNLISALKRVRAMLIALGFNYKTREDMEHDTHSTIDILEHADNQLCCKFWLYCSVEEKFLHPVPSDLPEEEGLKNYIRCICHYTSESGLPIGGCCIDCKCEEPALLSGNPTGSCAPKMKYSRMSEEYNNRSGRFKRMKPAPREPPAKRQKIVE